MNKILYKFNQQNLKVFWRDDVDQSVFNEIFKYKEYRAADQIIKQAKDPIVDVGGHAGFFSLYCRLLNPLAKVYSLEPVADNVKLFGKHLKENKLQNIKIIQGALAAKSGQREVVLSQDSHNHRLLLEDEMSVGGEMITVEAYSLSDLFKKLRLKKASLIKMDIEGGEYEVLESLRTIDFKLFDALVMEYHASRNQEIKKSRNQTLENILRVNKFGVQNFPSQFDRNLGFLLAVRKRES